MSSYQYFINSHSTQASIAALAPSTSPSAYHGRRRGPPRLSVSNQKHMRASQRPPTRDMMPEPTSVLEYREHLEQWISFDLEDDLEFCPNLVTESDLISHSSGSERSSLAGDSPNASPLQQPQTVLPGFSFSASSSFSSTSSSNSIPLSLSQQHSVTPLYQPTASRTRNAIPIINPATGLPSPSVSPNHLARSIAHHY
jgi:hypothetical protein